MSNESTQSQIQSSKEDLSEFLKNNYPILEPIDIALGFTSIVFCPLSAFYIFLHGEFIGTGLLAFNSLLWSGVLIDDLINRIRKRSEIANVVNQVRKGEVGFELGSLSENLSYFDEEQAKTLIGNLKKEEVV